MFEDCLYQLIQSHNRVIVPELGAFLRKDKTDSSEGSLIFSPFLRFNDGLLEDFVATKKKTTKEEAAKLVQDFVRKVKDTASGAQAVVIKKLGAFYTDGRGTIQFLFSENTKDIQKNIAELAGRQQAATAAKPAEEPVQTDVEPPAVSVATEEFDEAPLVKTKRKGKVKPKTESEETDDIENNDGDDLEKDVPPAAPSKLDAAATQLGKWMKTNEKQKSQPPSEPAREDTNSEFDDEYQKPKEIAATSTTAPASSDSDADDISVKAKALYNKKMEEINKTRSRIETGNETEEKPYIPERKNSTMDNYDEPFYPPPRTPRRKSARRWFIALIIAAGALIAAYLLWEDLADIGRAGKNKISAMFAGGNENGKTAKHSKKKKKKADTLPETSISAEETPKQVDMPAKPQITVKKQERGMYYLAVAKFGEVDFAREYCEILLRLKYDRAEVVITAKNEYAVCLAKDASRQAIIELQATTPYKHGERKTWILP